VLISKTASSSSPHLEGATVKRRRRGGEEEEEHEKARRPWPLPSPPLPWCLSVCLSWCVSYPCLALHQRGPISSPSRATARASMACRYLSPPSPIFDSIAHSPLTTHLSPLTAAHCPLLYFYLTLTPAQPHPQIPYPDVVRPFSLTLLPNYYFTISRSYLRCAHYQFDFFPSLLPLVKMTLPVACPAPSSSNADPPTVPQRKRRRRAPASGATDDCFACTKRNTKCDRRRPYCSPCLEIGKECSGYKTQLTWGVGVASRGKLRGLSLPVARSAPAPKSPPVSRHRTLSTTSNLHGDDGVRIKLEHAGSMPSTPFTTYDFVNMAPHGVANPPMHHQLPEWSIPVSHDYPAHDYHQESMSHPRHLPQLHRLHTLSLGRGDMALSSSLESLSAYAESDYASPISQSFQDNDIPYLNSPVPIYNSYSSQNSVPPSPVAGMMGDSRGPTSCPDPFYAQSEMSSSISSHQNLYDIAEARQHQASPAGGDVFYEDDMIGK
jgi:hypothetical protein